MKGSFNLAETAVAIMGLWFIVSPLPDFLAGVFTYLLTDFSESSDAMWIGTFAFTTIKVILGLVLIGFRSQIASLIGQNESVSLEISNVLSAAILVLGLYFVIDGSVSLGQDVALNEQPNVSNPYLYWQGIFSIIIGSLLSAASVLISRIWWIFQRGET